MTIDDNIKDVKLKYDINREVAKISALYSGQINKHELLTCEEILPIHQTRILEQGKFSYSSLGQAFGKQTKTIKEQGRKQIEAIKEHGKQLVKSNAFAKKEKQTIPLDKQKEIFHKLVVERTEEIEKIHNSANFQKLKYFTISRVPLKI